jgi:hypothetical protein
MVQIPLRRAHRLRAITLASPTKKLRPQPTERAAPCRPSRAAKYFDGRFYRHNRRAGLWFHLMTWSTSAVAVCCCRNHANKAATTTSRLAAPAASLIESRAILKQDFVMRGVIRPFSDFNVVLGVVFV